MRLERHQVVHQPLHPPRLARHDPEEPLARLGVVPRVVLQRLDVADDRGQRRPELVAGVGDEVRAQLLGAARLGAVLDLHDPLRLRPEGVARRQEADARLEEPLAPLVRREAHPPLLAVGQRRGHRLDEGRRADQVGEMRAGLQPRQRLVRRRVGVADPPGARDDEERRRQLLDQRPPEAEGIAGPPARPRRGGRPRRRPPPAARAPPRRRARPARRRRRRAAAASPASRPAPPARPPPPPARTGTTSPIIAILALRPPGAYCHRPARRR